MEERVMKLYKASKEGDVISLNVLIEQDPSILERCRTMPYYEETPLHIAAMHNRKDFCVELLRINPGLVLELNSRNSSALHLASALGHTETVAVLVSAGRAMCSAYDRDGYTPFHLAAMKGRIAVLEVLAKVCPDAVWASVTALQGGNVLHLCVTYNQTEALKFLVMLQKGNQFLNSVDLCGNSILHLAVRYKQVEIIQYLVLLQPSIDVNVKNTHQSTAWDILIQQPIQDSKYKEIEHFLQILIGKPPPLTCAHLSESNSKSEKEDHVSLDKQRNSLMVVASLIATMAFQAGVNPPSGFKPATKIYNSFVISNTIGFLSSLSIILLLISGLPIQHKAFTSAWTAIMWISIGATTCTYTIALSTISDWNTYSIHFRIVIAAWFDLMALLFLGHTIRILSQRIKDWTIEKKVCVLIFIVVMWTVAAVLGMPVLPIYSLHHHTPFAVLFAGWIVLATLSIVLYVIKLVFLIIENWESWSEEFKSHFRSSNPVAIP